MPTLLIILLSIFLGVGAMVVLGERFAKPLDPEQQARISRWIFPLVGLLLVLSALRYFLGW